MGKQELVTPIPQMASLEVERLLSHGLFNLADKVLHFPGNLFRVAIRRHVGVVGNFSGLLLDCAFDFVKLAFCLILRARFHHDSLLCADTRRTRDLLLRRRAGCRGRRLRLGSWGRDSGGSCLFLRLRLVVMVTGLFLRLGRLGGLRHRSRRSVRSGGRGGLRRFLRRQRQRARKHSERHKGRSN